MKKTLSLLLVLLLVFACLAMMGASCGKNPSGDNGGNNNNQGTTGGNGSGTGEGGKDDGGNTPPTIVPGETVESDVECVNSAWTDSELVIMNINDWSQKRELTAGGRAYVSGRNDYTVESAHATNQLLKKVIQRNSDAAAYANVSLAYSYTAETSGWGSAYQTIGENIASGVSGMPDVYYDSVYDMVAASIKGYFLNVLGNEYYHGADETPAAGYNRDYMDVMTFSTKAEYLIASDYSVDISRSFFVLPVNMNILTEKAGLVVDDRTGDLVIDVDDFFDVIDKEDWTWDFIAQLCEAVKVESAPGEYDITGGIVGMAIDGKAGLAAAGLCYASELQIITRTIDEVTGEYVYTYETEGAALSSVAVPLANSIKLTDGFVLNMSDNGYSSSTEAIANAFSEGHALIGNVILLGAIEQDVYRSMWDEENDRLGFVCAPMPLYHKGTADAWTYHTVVHNLAKVFGVVTTVKRTEGKLDRILAFLDYASTHSTEILDEFYQWTILYDAANGDEHNVRYLTNMKSKMEYNLDKTVDDALGCVGSDYFTSEQSFYANTWHKLLRDGEKGTADDGFGIGAGIVGLYTGLYEVKQNAVVALQQRFVEVSK